MMPLPPAPALVILTLVFIIAVKVLHAFFGALPGVSSWWRIIVALKGSMKVEMAGNSLSIPSWSKPRSDIDRKAPDVEMGYVFQ